MAFPMATGATIATAIFTALVLSSCMLYTVHSQSKKRQRLRQTVEFHSGCATAHFLMLFWSYAAPWQP